MAKNRARAGYGPGRLKTVTALNRLSRNRIRAPVIVKGFRGLNWLSRSVNRLTLSGYNWLRIG